MKITSSLGKVSALLGEFHVNVDLFLRIATLFFFQHVVYMSISVFNIYKVGSDVCYLLAMQLLTDISQY